MLSGCVRERVNPLDPQNPNSNVSILPPPTGLEITPDYCAIYLRWNEVLDAQKYQIYRDDERVATVEITYFYNTGLSPSQKYMYHVASVHSCGLGGHKSDPVYATPLKTKIVFSKYFIYWDDNSNGKVNPGEDIEMDIYVKNIGADKALWVEALLSSNDAYVVVTRAHGFHYNMYPNDEDFYNYRFSVSSNAPHGHIMDFYLDIWDVDNNSWVDSFTVPVE